MECEQYTNEHSGQAYLSGVGGLHGDEEASSRPRCLVWEAGGREATRRGRDWRRPWYLKRNSRLRDPSRRCALEHLRCGVKIGPTQQSEQNRGAGASRGLPWAVRSPSRPVCGPSCASPMGPVPPCIPQNQQPDVCFPISPLSRPFPPRARPCPACVTICARFGHGAGHSLDAPRRHPRAGPGRHCSEAGERAGERENGPIGSSRAGHSRVRTSGASV